MPAARRQAVPTAPMRRPWPPLLLAAALVSTPAPAPAQGADVQVQRERAVSAARAGQIEAAARDLAGLLERSADPAVAHDLVVVLTWAGRNEEALRLFEQRAMAATAPDYVIAAAARAYRATKNFSRAASLAETALSAKPDDPAWIVFLSLLETDQGKAVSARQRLERLVARDPGNAEAWLALGYAARSAGDAFAAMRAYAEARKLAPGNGEAARELSLILQGMRAPHGAALHHGAETPALQAQQAAAMVRWGLNSDALPGNIPFAVTDSAIARMETLIRKAESASPPDAELLRNLKRDRAVALRQRQRWGDTVAAVEALRREGDAIPGYVRMAEADALLALRQPQRAREAYAELLKADPASRDARVGLFFAEIELENFNAAFALADALAAEGGPRRAGRSRPEPDDDWLGAQILAANARHYADMHAEAWSRLLPLAERAPALGYLRAALGSVAAARGWPQRAEEEIRIAAGLAPDDRGIAVALADADLRRRDVESARRRAAALAASHPDDQSVQRLIRDLGHHDLREFRIDTAKRKEYGSALSSPGGGSQVATRLLSSPFDGRWRALAAAERYTATPVEGRVERERLGVGAAYEHGSATVEAIAWNNEGTLSKGGASLIGSWRASDHWILYGGAEAYSADSPLRAQYYGITGNALDLGAEYRWHESRSLAAALRSVDFSDGNLRQSARVVFSQRLIDRPHFDLDIRPEYYSSRNSRAGAPYFNPESDSALSVALQAEHVLSRHYDRSWVQRIALAAGSYRQAGFSAKSIGSVTYEQRYRFDPTLEIRYGLDNSRRVYDGTGERALTGFIGLTKRF